MKKFILVGVATLVVGSATWLQWIPETDQPIPPPFDSFLLGFELEPITDKAYLDELAKSKKAKRDLFESKWKNEMTSSRSLNLEE